MTVTKKDVTVVVLVAAFLVVVFTVAGPVLGPALLIAAGFAGAVFS